MSPPPGRNKSLHPPLVIPSAAAAVAFSALSLIAVGYTSDGSTRMAQAFLATGPLSSSSPSWYRKLDTSNRRSSQVAKETSGPTGLDYRDRLRRGASITEGEDRGVRRHTQARHQRKTSGPTSLKHRDGGGSISASSSGTTSPFAVVMNVAGAEGMGGNLAELKLPELKALYRERGGKPGTLRKPELLEKLLTSVVEQIGDRRRVSGTNVSELHFRSSPAMPSGALDGAQSVTIAGPQHAVKGGVDYGEHGEDPPAAESSSFRTHHRYRQEQEREEGQAGDRGSSPGAAGRGLASEPQASFNELGGPSASEVRVSDDGRGRRHKMTMSESPTSELAGVESPGEDPLPDAVTDWKRGQDEISADARTRRGAAVAAVTASVDEGLHSRAASPPSPNERLRPHVDGQEWTRRATAVGSGQDAFHCNRDGEQGNLHKSLREVAEGAGQQATDVDSYSDAAGFDGDPGDVIDGIQTPTRAAVLMKAASTNASAEHSPQSVSATLLHPGRSGREGGGRGGTGLRSWRRASASQGPRSGGDGATRQKLMPLAPNPWARSGEPEVEEWISPKNDVVDEFLTHRMMQFNNKIEEAVVDPVFSRDDRFDSMPGTTMSLSFLGTASCIPSTSRGVSSAVLRREGNLWMFDVGEGTQIQVQKCSMKPSKISKIFITHAHGDHSFGLPGLLCLMGQNYERGRTVEIYGPTGLRAYLRVAMRYTSSRITVPYVVHELKEVPFLHGDFVRAQPDFSVKIALDNRYGEQPGGRDILPDANGIFHVFDNEEVNVKATAMKHGVPCVGYCVEEHARPGRLKIEDLKPIVREHKEAIMAATNTSAAEWVLKDLKNLRPGEALTLPGTDVTIDYDQAVMPHMAGRKVVILGDTCDASSMVPLAQDADVVVHEATNTLLLPLDEGKTYGVVEHEAIGHGHSTPLMAAAFAASVGAKMLILNHFSARYRGDSSAESVAAMMRIEMQAMRAGGLERHQVVAAWDLLQVPVLSPENWDAHRRKAREKDAARAAAILARALEWKARRQGQEAGDEGVAVSAPATSPATLSGDGDRRGAPGDVPGISQAARRSSPSPSVLSPGSASARARAESGFGKYGGIAMSANSREGERDEAREAGGIGGETGLRSRVTVRLEATERGRGLDKGADGDGASEDAPALSETHARAGETPER